MYTCVYSWPLNNGEVRGTDPPCNKNPHVIYCQLFTLQCLCACRFSQPRIMWYCNIYCWEKFMSEWSTQFKPVWFKGQLCMHIYMICVCECVYKMECVWVGFASCRTAQALWLPIAYLSWFSNFVLSDGTPGLVTPVKRGEESPSVGLFPSRSLEVCNRNWLSLNSFSANNR